MPIPPLTEERRKEFVKKLHHVAEDHRVSGPQHPPRRQRAVKKLLKDKTISEDDERRAHDEIQKLMDGYIAKLEQGEGERERHSRS